MTGSVETPWPGRGSCRSPPDDMDQRRLLRWCMVRTLRDIRLSRETDHPLPGHHAALRFARRVHRAGVRGALDPSIRTGKELLSTWNGDPARAGAWRRVVNELFQGDSNG